MQKKTNASSLYFLLLIAGASWIALSADGTAFGEETDLSWGINLWNATRHPTQIHETLSPLS